MALRRLFQLSSVFRSAVSVTLRRNIGISAVLFNKAKDLDPVQKLFLDKIREYSVKSKWVWMTRWPYVISRLWPWDESVNFFFSVCIGAQAEWWMLAPATRRTWQKRSANCKGYMEEVTWLNSLTSNSQVSVWSTGVRSYHFFTEQQIQMQCYPYPGQVHVSFSLYVIPSAKVGVRAGKIHQ